MLIEKNVSLWEKAGGSVADDGSSGTESPQDKFQKRGNLVTLRH
jgi:hypothetical protein